jgi:tripartite-type tricarboxylate transporter receptor subunit TctC
MKLIISLLILFYSNIVLADEYKMIIVTGPGSAMDFAARRIAASFKEKNPQHNIVILNIPGGSTNNLPISIFKSQEAILVSNSSTHVINFVTMPDLLQYEDKDFNYVGISVRTPAVWYVNANSQIQTGNDLLSKLKREQANNICSDSSFFEFHSTLFMRHNFLEKQVQYINFKTTAETLISVLNNTCSAGITSMNPGLLGQVKAKKINLLGVTSAKGTNINGGVIPYIGNNFTDSGRAFSGFNLISLSNKFSSKDAIFLKAKLWESMNDKKVLEDINNQGLDADPLEGDKVQVLINNYREILKKFIK